MQIGAVRWIHLEQHENYEHQRTHNPFHVSNPYLGSHNNRLTQRPHSRMSKRLPTSHSSGRGLVRRMTGRCLTRGLCRWSSRTASPGQPRCSYPENDAPSSAADGAATGLGGNYRFSSPAIRTVLYVIGRPAGTLGRPRRGEPHDPDCPSRRTDPHCHAPLDQAQSASGPGCRSTAASTTRATSAAACLFIIVSLQANNERFADGCRRDAALPTTPSISPHLPRQARSCRVGRTVRFRPAAAPRRHLWSALPSPFCEATPRPWHRPQVSCSRRARRPMC